jgi:hypothetical protein
MRAGDVPMWACRPHEPRAAQALSSDLSSLHTYLTNRLGTIRGIRDIESALILLTLKATRTPRARV